MLQMSFNEFLTKGKRSKWESPDMGVSLSRCLEGQFCTNDCLKNVFTLELYLFFLNIVDISKDYYCFLFFGDALSRHLFQFQDIFLFFNGMRRIGICGILGLQNSSDSGSDCSAFSQNCFWNLVLVY